MRVKDPTTYAEDQPKNTKSKPQAGEQEGVHGFPIAKDLIRPLKQNYQNRGELEGNLQ